MRYLISLICIALLLWGCDSGTAVPAKPTVVRKKIVAPKSNTAKVSTKRTVQTVKKKPARKSQTQRVVANVDRPQTDVKDKPAANNQSDSRTLIASNEKTRPVPAPQPRKQVITKPVPQKRPSPVKQKKPAISPKSEFTKIKPTVTVKKEPKPPASKTGKTVASIKAGAAKPAKSSTPKLTMGSKSIPRYNPRGKIDPFEPLVREKPTLAKKKKKQIKREPKTPLERISLSQLRLTAIVLASSGNRALVEENTGKGYVVKQGTYIGTNGGKIVSIDKQMVIVEEKFEDFTGKIQTRKREIKLPKPPGEF